MEKEVAGIYLSGHPLDEHREELASMNYPGIGNVSSEETDYRDGSEISVVGIISNRRDKLTRSNTNMSFITVEDFTGSMEVIVFPKILAKLDAVLEENSIVMMHGRLDIKDDEGVKLILDSAVPFFGKKESIVLSLSDSQLMLLDKLKDISLQHRGTRKLVIDSSYGELTVNNILVDGSEEFFEKLRKLFGIDVLKNNT